MKNSDKGEIETHLLDGLNAIVTGGGQGLGLATAKCLAAHGSRVFIFDLDYEKAMTAAGSLPGNGHLGIQGDVTNNQDRQNLVDTITAMGESIDVLVNNAGIQYHTPAIDVDEDQWRRLFEVNVHAMMFMSRDVGRIMVQQRSGSIINIGSIASILGMPKRSIYVTTKTAVLGITRSLAVEWASAGVRVNALGPGYHRTPLFEEYVERGAIDAQRIQKRIPMGRLGAAEDVGRAVVFFASPLSSYVTGQFLMVDGGYTVFGAPEDASL